jgi:hypothetical protein
MIIREIDPKQVDSVITLFNYYRDEAGITDERYDENRVLQTIREYSIRPNLFFRVAYMAQRPIGVIGGFLSQDPIESEHTATIQFNYLIPEFATVDGYAQLIAVFEDWAHQLGITQIRAIDIGHNLTRLDDVYDVLGFDPVRISIMNKEIR